VARRMRCLCRVRGAARYRQEVSTWSGGERNGEMDTMRPRRFDGTRAGVWTTGPYSAAACAPVLNGCVDMGMGKHLRVVLNGRGWVGGGAGGWIKRCHAVSEAWARG